MGGDPVPLNYVPIVIFAVLGAIAGLAPLIIGILLRPHRPYRAKLLPYESGSPLFMDARVQFPMRYYIIAMLFVIFDIEIVFMFPWAVIYGELALFGLIEMAVFIAILLVGYIYILRIGALKWD